MVKKWRSCLSLLVSFAFILLMLFSVTLEVEARSSFNGSFSLTLTADSIQSDVSGRVSGSGSVSGGGGSSFINNGSGTIFISSVSGTSSVTGSVSTSDTYYVNSHIKVPFIYTDTWANLGFNRSEVLGEYIACVIDGFSASCSRGTISNVALYDGTGNLLTTSPFDLSKSHVWFGKGSSLDSANSSYFCMPFILEFDLADTWYTFHDDMDYTINVSAGLYSRYATADEIKNATLIVEDSGANAKLDDISSSESAIQESVTSDTGGGILATIKNFFGGFFTNLFNSILSLFVPSSDYFTTWFSNVNTLLSDKLGMLYAPLDLLISTLNAVYSASSDFSGVPFPEIKWGDTVLVSAQNLTFSNLLGEHFEDIQGYVYFGTDVVLLFAFLMLLQRKITLVLRGHESG